jgi:hypothetical protein
VAVVSSGLTVIPFLFNFQGVGGCSYVNHLLPYVYQWLARINNLFISETTKNKAVQVLYLSQITLKKKTFSLTFGTTSIFHKIKNKTVFTN